MSEKRVIVEKEISERERMVIRGAVHKAAKTELDELTASTLDSLRAKDELNELRKKREIIPMKLEAQVMVEEGGYMPKEIEDFNHKRYTPAFTRQGEALHKADKKIEQELEKHGLITGYISGKSVPEGYQIAQELREEHLKMAEILFKAEKAPKGKSDSSQLPPPPARERSSKGY